MPPKHRCFICGVQLTPSTQHARELSTFEVCWFCTVSSLYTATTKADTYICSCRSEAYSHIPSDDRPRTTPCSQTPCLSHKIVHNTSCTIYICVCVPAALLLLLYSYGCFLLMYVLTLYLLLLRCVYSQLITFANHVAQGTSEAITINQQESSR